MAPSLGAALCGDVSERLLDGSDAGLDGFESREDGGAGGGVRIEGRPEIVGAGGLGELAFTLPVDREDGVGEADGDERDEVGRQRFRQGDSRSFCAETAFTSVDAMRVSVNGSTAKNFIALPSAESSR